MPPAEHEGAHEAAAAGKVDILKAIAQERGAKALMEVNKNGHSPAFLAAAGGHGKCLSLIHMVCGPASIRNLADGGLSAAHLAALRGHADCLTDIAAFDRGVLSETTLTGCTPCYFACVAGRSSCVQRLYNLGERASLFAVDKAGKSTLDAARESGHAPVLELLEELKRISGDHHSPMASSVYIGDDDGAGAGVGGLTSPSSNGERTPKKFMGAAASFMRKSMTKETGTNPLAFSPKDETADKGTTSFSTRGSRGK